MKEVLFRAKRMDNGEWVYGGLIHDKYRYFIVEHDADIRWMDISFCEICKIWNIDPETLGQYIGITDKHRKQIYEGDIIKATVSFFYAKPVIEAVIEFKNGCFVAKAINKLYRGDLFFMNQLENIEILGNIYDDVEMFKEMIK